MKKFLGSVFLRGRPAQVGMVVAFVAVLAVAIVATKPWDWGQLTVVSAEAPSDHAQVCTLQVDDRAEAVADYFSSMDYLLAQVRQRFIPVPRVFLTSLPSNLEDQVEVDIRKRLFLRAVLPLVLRENERLLHLRADLRAQKAAMERGDSLPDAEAQKLAETFELYNADQGDWPTLLRRVDAIPVSLAMAQAAVESGWGLSRFAQEGNSLFGQWTFKRRQSGIVPEERDDGGVHRVRAFDSLQQSVRSYIHNLNSHWAYMDLRAQREQLRTAQRPLSGLAMASGLLQYSERGEEYVAELRDLIRDNDLQDLDSLQLAEKILDCEHPMGYADGMHVVLVASTN